MINRKGLGTLYYRGSGYEIRHMLRGGLRVRILVSYGHITDAWLCDARWRPDFSVSTWHSAYPW